MDDCGPWNRVAPHPATNGEYPVRSEERSGSNIGKQMGRIASKNESGFRYYFPAKLSFH